MVITSICHSIFHTLYCSILSVNAGCKALPSLINIVQVMQQTQVGHIVSKDELPVNNIIYKNHLINRNLFEC